MLAGMAVKRMDNVGIVFADLKAAVAFFLELGLELEGQGSADGQWVNSIVGLDDVHVDIAMMRTPDGHSKLELMQFQHPAAVGADPNAPANTLGLRRLMFAVDDIDDVITRLRPHGAELVGEVAQFENLYLMCYLRGPEGVIVALAQELF